MKSSHAAVVGFVVVAAAAFTLVLTHAPGPDGKVGVRSAAAKCTDEDKCLPGLTLTDTTGHAWTPEELQGKVVLINFWATWCNPCIAEVPLLTEYQQEHKDDGLVVLGLMTDQVTDASLETFKSTYGLEYPVVRVQDREVYAAWDNPSGLPTTFLYDRQGTLRKMHVGPLRRGMIDALLSELIAD